MEQPKQRTCKTCGAQFMLPEGKYASGDFCSKTCAMRFSSKTSTGKKKILACTACGESEEVDCHTPFKTFLCSKCRRKKRDEARRPRKPGKFAVKLGSLHSSIFKHGWTFIPKSGKNVGRKIIRFDRFDGTSTSKLYARYLIEESLGRFLDPGETVDHIDNDKTNDSIENLQVLSWSENIKKYYAHVKEKDQ